MSLRASTWVLYESPVTDPTKVLILWALADRADENGHAAYPAQEWLAERARCTTRTVRRHLGVLEREGHIRRGDQQLVAHFRPDRRPIVWDVVMGSPQRADDVSARHDRTPEVGTAGHLVHNDRTPMSYKPSSTVRPNRNQDSQSSVTEVDARVGDDDREFSTPGDHLVDTESVRRHLVVVTGREARLEHAIEVSATVLDRAKSYPAKPTAYVKSAITRDEHGWCKYMDTGKVPR